LNQLQIVTPETTTGRILLEYNYQTHTFWSIVKSPVISPVTGVFTGFSVVSSLEQEVKIAAIS
jgi:hypothetical protein